MSRDEASRFRITPWPSVVELPQRIAVPRLVGLGQTVNVGQTGYEGYGKDEWTTRIELGPLEESFDTIGPFEVRDSRAPEELWHEWVHIDPGFRAEYPGCEEGMLRAAAREEEWPSALVIEDAPPRLVELPDELFLREFLAVNIAVDATLIDFVGQWGPLSLPMPDKDTGTVSLVPRAWQALTQRDVVGFRAGELSYKEELEERVAAMGDVRAAIETQHRHEEERKIRVSREAGANPFDAQLDEGWRAEGRHRIALWSDDRIYHGSVAEEKTITSEADPRYVVSVRAYSLPAQRYAIGLYQAVIESWLTIDVSAGVNPATLGLDLDDEQARIWSSRGLDVPRDVFEMLNTICAVVSEGAAMAGPRIELTHPRLEALGGAYGRPIPGIAGAIAVQLLGWVAEGVPARRCANETCANWFTRQRGRAVAGQFRTTGVLYCSSACARAQASRKYRRRNRSRG